MAQLGRHRLDDDFLGVKHAIDHDAEGVAADHRRAAMVLQGGDTGRSLTLHTFR